MTGTQGKTKEAAQEVTHGVPELSTMVVTGMRSNTIPNGMPVITTMVRPLRPGRVLLEVTVSDGLCLVAGGALLSGEAQEGILFPLRAIYPAARETKLPHWWVALRPKFSLSPCGSG